MSSMLERTVSIISVGLLLIMVAMAAGFSKRSQYQFQVPVVVPEVEMFAEADVDPKKHSQQYRLAQIEERFQQAVAMLHAKEYEFAIKALQRVIELAPRMPEAYVNTGYALIGMEDYKTAADFFGSAIELKPYQANAYWGLAVSMEKQGELDAALGAMRTFIHLSPPNDPFLRQARSALWEWESSLKRGPLPEAEQEWVDRRSREWDERNSPEADAPQKADLDIDLN